MATCGSNQLLDDINKAVDEITSAIDDAISDVNEGIAAAIDEIEGAINDAVSGLNEAVDGLIPDLPETNTTLIVEAAALFALRDNPVAFVAAAAALAAKYGNAPGVDIDAIVDKMFSGSFDPCKDVPNIEINDKGESTQKGAAVTPPNIDAIKIEPNELPRGKEQVVSSFATDNGNSADVGSTKTKLELEKVTVQSEPPVKDPPVVQLKDTLVFHKDELLEKEVTWDVAKYVQAGKLYPVDYYDPAGMLSEEEASERYYAIWVWTKKVRLSALRRYLDLAKNAKSTSGDAELTKVQITAGIRSEIAAKEKAIADNDKKVNEFATYVATNKDKYPQGSEALQKARSQVTEMERESTRLYGELLKLQDEYNQIISDFDFGAADSKDTDVYELPIGDLEADIALLEGLKPSNSAPANAINFLERSPDQKFWTP